MLRRTFLQTLGAATATVLLPAWNARATMPAYGRGTLILLELKGGNDGLNTVVPHDQPAYYRLRPALAIARDMLLPLDEHTALNPALADLLPLWQAGQLAIVQGVGYPRPDRSHFRSIEIWETGSATDEFLREGWLTRDFALHPPPASALAEGVVLDHNTGPLAGSHSIQLARADRFIRQSRRLTPLHAPANNPALAHLLAVQAATRQAGDRLAGTLAQQPRPAGFPATAIGRQLQTAARLILAGTPVPVIKLSHGSFDTHSNQRKRHDRLLQQLGEALAAFHRTLEKGGQWDRVLLMSYSEFGRRVAENGSRGTDHGTAAPHFLLGGKVRGGLYGPAPRLDRLQDGDLAFGIDFRRLYATVSRDWFGLETDPWRHQHRPLAILRA